MNKTFKDILEEKRAAEATKAQDIGSVDHREDHPVRPVAIDLKGDRDAAERVI